MKIHNLLVSTIFLSSLLIGCGGGGGSSGSSGSTTVTGHLIDAPVAGIAYTCGSNSGTTDNTGAFTYALGTSCTFSVGKVTIGTVSVPPTDGNVTPYDLAGVTRTNTTNQSAQAIAQFLQSLDNGSTSNVITIPASVTTALASVTPTAIISNNTPIGQTQLASLVSTATNNTKTLVAASMATSNLNSYLQTANINTSVGVPGASAAALTISASVDNGSIGTAYNLTWSGTSVSNCVASGAWTGNLAVSGTQAVTPSVTGTNTYTITCGSTTASKSVNVLPQYISIPDPVFADALTRLGYPVVNGQMAGATALTIDKFVITSMVGFWGTADANNILVNTNTSVPDYMAKVAYTTGAPITDVTGLESFLNLKAFRIEGEDFTSVTLAPLQSLTFFSFWREPLTSIDLSHNKALTMVGLSETNLTTVDMSALTNLVEFDGQQSSIPLPYQTGLNNAVTVSGWTNIKLPQSPNFLRIYISDNSTLTSIDLNPVKNSLQEFYATDTGLTSIDFTGANNLTRVGLNLDANLTSVKMGTATPRTLFTANDPMLHTILVPTATLGYWDTQYTSMLAALACQAGTGPSGCTPGTPVWVDTTYGPGIFVGY